MLDGIRQMLPEPGGVPFFLYAQCMDPHDRYVAPKPFNQMFLDELIVPAETDSTGANDSGDESSLSRTDKSEAIGKDWQQMIRGDIFKTIRADILDGYATKVINDIDEGLSAPVTEAETSFLKSQYKSEIRYIDRMIGQLFRDLHDRYKGDKFIVFVVSDHGESFMEHKSLSHGRDLYQEGIRVIWMSGTMDFKAQSRIVPQDVSVLDVFSTLLGRLDYTPSIPNDGFDVYKPVPDSPRMLFSLLRNQRDHLPFWRAAIRNDRKVLYVQDQPPQMFDLKKDPSELHPFPVDETDPLYSTLTELIRSDQTDRGHYEAPPKVLEQLKSLGYVH